MNIGSFILLNTCSYKQLRNLYCIIFSFFQKSEHYRIWCGQERIFSPSILSQSFSFCKVATKNYHVKKKQSLSWSIRWKYDHKLLRKSYTTLLIAMQTSLSNENIYLHFFASLLVFKSLISWKKKKRVARSKNSDEKYVVWNLSTIR